MSAMISKEDILEELRRDKRWEGFDVNKIIASRPLPLMRLLNQLLMFLFCMRSKISESEDVEMKSEGEAAAEAEAGAAAAAAAAAPNDHHLCHRLERRIAHHIFCDKDQMSLAELRSRTRLRFNLKMFLFALFWHLFMPLPALVALALGRKTLLRNTSVYGIDMFALGQLCLSSSLVIVALLLVSPDAAVAGVSSVEWALALSFHSVRAAFVSLKHSIVAGDGWSKDLFEFRLSEEERRFREVNNSWYFVGPVAARYESLMACFRNNLDACKQFQVVGDNGEVKNESVLTFLTNILVDEEEKAAGRRQNTTWFSIIMAIYVETMKLAITCVVAGAPMFVRYLEDGRKMLGNTTESAIVAICSFGVTFMTVYVFFLPYMSIVFVEFKRRVAWLEHLSRLSDDDEGDRTRLSLMKRNNLALFGPFRACLLDIGRSFQMRILRMLELIVLFILTLLTFALLEIANLLNLGLARLEFYVPTATLVLIFIVVLIYVLYYGSRYNEQAGKDRLHLCYLSLRLNRADSDDYDELQQLLHASRELLALQRRMSLFGFPLNRTTLIRILLVAVALFASAIEVLNSRSNSSTNSNQLNN